jgi:hypothetical protein
VCPVRVLLFDFVLLDLTMLFSSCTVLIFPPATTAAKAIIFFLENSGRLLRTWPILDFSFTQPKIRLHQFLLLFVAGG